MVCYQFLSLYGKRCGAVVDIYVKTEDQEIPFIMAVCTDALTEFEEEGCIWKKK